MATNKIFQSTTARHRARLLSTITNPSTPPTTIQPGVPVTFADGPAVSLTASGNATKTQTTPLPSGLTSITYQNPGAGLASGEASFAFDGTWEFAVTGALTSTANGVPVYIVAADGTLTLTAGSNTIYGYTDYPKDYTKQAGRAAVRVGKN
jgi:hypothetical protein